MWIIEFKNKKKFKYFAAKTDFSIVQWMLSSACSCLQMFMPTEVTMFGLASWIVYKISCLLPWVAAN